MWRRVLATRRSSETGSRRTVGRSGWTWRDTLGTSQRCVHSGCLFGEKRPGTFSGSLRWPGAPPSSWRVSLNSLWLSLLILWLLQLSSVTICAPFVRLAFLKTALALTSWCLGRSRFLFWRSMTQGLNLLFTYLNWIIEIFLYAPKVLVESIFKRCLSRFVLTIHLCVFLVL